MKMDSGLWYGVATISRLLKITGLLCRISSLLLGSSAKETYKLKCDLLREWYVTMYDDTCGYIGGGYD